MVVKVQCGDCLKLMNSIPDKSIDMILCDLPYGVTQNKNDVRLPFDKLWSCYERIIKDDGCIALFGQGIFYVDLVNSNRKLFRYDLVWDKVLTSGFLNAKRMPLRQHEQIAIFYKKKPVYNPQFTKGKPLHSKGTAYKTAERKNENYGKFGITDDSRSGCEDKYPTSILRFAKPHPSVAKHRTEKSIELLEWLIKTYTNPNDIVLDNCLGGGSTGLAAVNTGRSFIGFEIDVDYYNIAKTRIMEAFKKKYEQDVL